MTVNEAYKSFIEYGRSYWAPKTLTYYERNLGFFLDFLQGSGALENDINTLSSTVLMEYLVYLRSRDRYSSHPLRSSMKSVDGKIKSNTVNSYMRAVKAFFNYLYRLHLTDQKFTEGVRLPRSDDDQIIPLLRDEVARIDAVFDRTCANDLRNLCIIHLMLDAGLRVQEVISLRPGDVIFDSNTIVVNRSKGDKSRVVILAPPLLGYLKDYISVFKPVGVMFFTAVDHNPISESAIRALFLRVIRNTGISRLHPHLLRHTFATSYIMGGGNLETLRILMGHFDYSVTRKYLHLASQYQILGADIYPLDPVFFRTAYR